MEKQAMYQSKLFIILAIIVFVAGITWAKTAEEWFKKGVSAMEVGYHNVAIKCFDKAIALDPNDLKSHLNIGLIYSKKGDTKKAISYYKKAIAINPDFAEAHYNLGAIYAEKRKWGKAISEFKETINIKSNYWEAHRELGSVYNKKKMYHEAITELRKAIDLEPNDAKIHSQLGIAYSSKGIDFKAADHFYKASLLFLKQDDRKDALKAYERLKLTKSKELEQALFEKLYPKLGQEKSESSD
jgi:tetratricopeptide (TPR) repeat protein